MRRRRPPAHSTRAGFPSAVQLGGHIDNPTLREQLGGMFEAIPALSADDIADLIAYTVSRPRHVNLRHLVALPTRQA